MRTVEYVELSYKYGLEQIKENSESWKDFLRLDGRIYNFEFNNVVVIYNQAKDSSILADFDTWNTSGRRVNRGAKAIKVYPSRVFTERANIRHLFDISQTTGKDVPNNWVMTDSLKEEFVKFYALNGDDNNEILRRFTKIIVGDTITERYDNVFSKYPKVTQDFISQSISYLIEDRCLIIDDDNYDLSEVSHLNSEILVQYGYIINNVAQEVLHDIFSDIQIINENIAKERDNYGQGLNAGSQIRRGRTRLLDTGDTERGADELRDKPLGTRVGGLDGRELSDGLRSFADVSVNETQSVDGRSIEESKRGNTTPASRNEEEEWDGQNRGLYGTPEADQLREFSSRGDSAGRSDTSEENVSVLNRAKQLINEYVMREFGEIEQFEDLSYISLAYTDIIDDDNNEYGLRVYVNLETNSIITRVDDIDIEEVQYNSLGELIDSELSFLDFDALVSVDDDLWDKIRHIKNTVSSQGFKNRLDQLQADKENEGVAEIAAPSFDVYNSFEDITELHKGDCLVSKSGNIHIVREDIVPLNHFPESVIRAYGQNEYKAEQLSEFFDEDDFIDYIDIREVRFNDGSVYHLTDDEIANLVGMNKAKEYLFFERKNFNDIGEYGFVDTVTSIGQYINEIIANNAPELRVVDSYLYGSRIGGYANEDSDLDVVLFVKSPSDNYIREDFLFNVLNGEPFIIGGITVDINPKIITSYTEIGDYLDSARQYMQEEKEKRLNLIDTPSSGGDVSDIDEIFDEDDEYIADQIEEELPDLDEISDTTEPATRDVFKQASLFDADFWMGYTTTGENIVPVTDFASNLLSQDSIEEIIKTDGRNTHGLTPIGRLEIYEKYRENLTSEEMVEFLKKEYGNISKGFTINGTQITMYSDKDGITFGQGESAKSSFIRRLSWEEVEKITRNLVESGNYLNISEIELVDDYTRRDLADRIDFLFRDIEEDYPEAVLKDCPGGYPDITDKISKKLKSTEYIRTVLRELKKLEDGIYTPRFAGWMKRSLKELVPDLTYYLRDKVSYQTRNDVTVISESFISQETVDIGLKGRGSHIAGGKLRIEEWFRSEHSTKDTIAFLRKEKGICGSSNWAGDDVWGDYDSRGLTVTVNRPGEDDLISKYDYGKVAKRLKLLVSRGEYLSEKEKKAYDSKMAARAAFIDGLEVGNIYRNTDKYSLLENECLWVYDIDKDNQSIKFIEIYLNDDFSFDIEKNNHIYRHSRSSDYNYIPDYNYEFVKNARDIGEINLVEYHNEELEKNQYYKWNNEYIVTLGSDITQDIDTQENIELNVQGVVYIEAYGEEYAFIINPGFSYEEILSVIANSENLFDELSNFGKQVYGVDATALYQSEKGAFSIDYVYGENKAFLSIVNDGKGGILEQDRIDNENSTARIEIDLDDYQVFTEVYEVENASDLENIINGTALDMQPYVEDIQDNVDIKNVEKDRINYRIDLDDIPDSVGPKGRFRRNIDAIKTLKTIESEHRLATIEEQKILSLYVGWGGLSEAFDSENENWTSEYRELKELLDDTEYTSARASVNTAFYTDPAIIKAVSDAVKNMGFKGGNILEPSCAIGNFFGTIDEEILDNSNVYGVEIDDVSGRIAKQLYQKVDISICGYEDTEFSDNFFDLAIGNVPFGQYKVFDKDYRDLSFNIHDYFFAKTLDKVRPGGIVAFITTIGTLDKRSDVVRKYIGERAELLGAIRLPDITFKDNAGTKAASDIIFLQKRDYRQLADQDWLGILPNEDDILINSYFIENPDMLLGKMATDNRYGDRSFTTCISDGTDLIESLNKAITSLPTDIYTEYTVVSDENELLETIPADPEVRNYTYTVIGEDIYFRTNSVMTKQNFKGKDKDRVKACISISDYVRKVMNMQLNGCTDDELFTALEGLNKAYDKFIKSYGYFHDRKNRSLFQDDDSYNILEALEENEDGKTYRKSPFFSRRTIKNAELVQSVDSVIDALNCSINEFGRVDLPYMASILDKDVEQIRKDMMSRGIPSSDLEYQTDEEIKMEEIIDGLSGIIFMNPLNYNPDNRYAGWETADEYLSGNVREKLRIAEEAAEKDADLFSGNVSALTEVIPEWIDASNIEVRLGTTWIEDNDYEQFMYELFDISNYYQRTETRWGGNNNSKIILEKDDFVNGEYYIANKSMGYSEKLSTTYGTSRLNGLEILEKLLNLKIVTVYDTYEDGDKKKRIINNKETMLAREKADIIKQEFKNWIFADPDRRDKYEKFYNENFNNTHLRSYNGDYLTFPGMTPTIELRPHQKNAVSRILLGGNTLLAHCVGAGKSFEMFAAVMEQRRLGIANKPAIIVPKSIVNQTANEFMRLYPTANLLVANTKNFAKKDRLKFLSRAATGDYDCIIMSHEQFKEIPISQKRKMQMLDKQYDLYTEALEQYAEKDRENGGKRWSIKKMERARQSIETKLKKIEDDISKGKIDLFTFEEIGIDSIFVDEAHGYKNREIITKMSNISGISTSGSVMAEDMWYKVQYLNEKNHGAKGVVFATGTPVSNSMCEMFVMQSYLQNDRLMERGVAAFDSWATAFGEVTQSLDLAVEGKGYRLRNKFNKFVNVPELLTMFHEFADVQTADMLQLPDVPTMRGGKAIIVESQVDDFTQMYMDSIVERAERLRNKQVTDPKVDNFLKITGEARLLGTDARLLDASAPDNPDGKLNKAADNIYKEYIESKEKGIIGTQLVFSDIGTPSPNKFNVYDELKSKLIERGIPEEEIAFIHDAGDSDSKKQKIFDNTQSGKIRVLFGSTSKLGTGVNVQNHLVALHHLDCPWRPSDIEQREGRGLRQGNENREVAVYRYVTVGTFDAYLWSVVENKQKFINQVMRGNISDRNMSDIDDTELGFAEIKAVASGNPKIKQKMELDMELGKLNMLKNAWKKNKYDLQDKILKHYPRDIARNTELIELIKADIITRDKELAKNPEFEITICGSGETLTERKDAGKKILELAYSVKTAGEKRYVAKYKGFEVYVEADLMGGTGITKHLLIKGESTMLTDRFSADYVGVVTQIENKIKGLDKRLETVIENLDQAKKNKEQAEIEFNKPFEHEERLAEVKKELNEINTELDLDNVQDEQMFAVDENADSLDYDEHNNKEKSL